MLSYLRKKSGFKTPIIDVYKQVVFLSNLNFDMIIYHRLQMLEESLRDVELRAAQQLTEEQRRNKELIVRVEREKQLEIENCTIK